MYCSGSAASRSGRSVPARVSVVMCTYNGARFVAAQLDSILAQDYPLYEIIIQDDGSTDGTPDVLEAYAARFPLIKVFRNAENLGYNRNFHTAMLRATGDYIAISDQDDVWFSNKIRRQLAAIGDAPACYTGHYVDAASDDDGQAMPAELRRLVSLRYPLARLMFTNCVPGHTLLLRRDFLLALPEWDYAIFYDWWLALCAVLGGGLVHLDEPLNWHRPHAASAISALFRGQTERRGRPERPWTAYVVGWGEFARLRRNPSWRRLYEFIYRSTSPDVHPEAHALCGALLGRDGGLLRLCRLCAKWRADIYPRKGEPRWLNALRAFCWPAIYAHADISFRPQST